MNICFPFFKKGFYLFIFRQKRGEGEKCVVDSCVPHTGKPGLQLRHVPWLGIEPATLRFIGWHSVDWATPAKAVSVFKNCVRVYVCGVTVWMHFLPLVMIRKVRKPLLMYISNEIRIMKEKNPYISWCVCVCGFFFFSIYNLCTQGFFPLTREK